MNDAPILLMKLIWRLDYDLSFDYYDRRGAVLRALLTEVPEFITKANESRPQNRFSGETDGKSPYVSVSVEPITINGTLEWPLGTDLESVLQHSAFRNSNKIASKLLATSGVTKINRAGVRLIIAMTNSKLVRVGNPGSIFSSNVIDLHSSSFGKIDDYASVIELSSDDKVRARVSMGPMAQSNIDMHMTRTKDMVSKDLAKNYQVILDIDVYEQNFFLLDKSIFRWATDKVAKAVKFVHSVA